MPNHKSSEKRVRQTEKRRTANRYYAQTMRNAMRDIRAAENKDEAKKQLPEVMSLIDKLVKRRQIHKNKAANLKSSVMKVLAVK